MSFTLADIQRVHSSRPKRWSVDDRATYIGSRQEMRGRQVIVSAVVHTMPTRYMVAIQGGPTFGVAANEII